MRRKPLRIVVADNDRNSRHALHQQLIDAGHKVCRSVLAGEVGMLCELDPPDVLILDVNLPDMDAFEVCERIRREAGGDDPTIILMTDASDDMIRTYIDQMADYAGGDYFLAKPFDPKLLLKLLDQLASERKPADRASAGFPTKVTWPTSRLSALAQAC
ncbi:MAG: response regulator transcription factor [Phycisphaerales bacterium]|nr:MAG: response regulator transcription factor [Phycisphaerales bacterium]